MNGSSSCDAASGLAGFLGRLASGPGYLFDTTLRQTRFFLAQLYSPVDSAVCHDHDPSAVK